DPVRIHATCEDYRAGRTTDLTHDEETRASGKKITCPLLAIWGAAGGIPAETDGPLVTWREWAINVQGFALDSGHYLAEEAPEATEKALLEFFAAASAWRGGGPGRWRRPRRREVGDCVGRTVDR